MSSTKRRHSDVASDRSRSQSPPPQVPERKRRTPVQGKHKTSRADPGSPISQLSHIDRLRRGVWAAKLQVYRHTPITEDQTRLLIVHRGELKSSIEVSLRIVPFAELGRSQDYEALSYHWDDGKEEHPVYFRDGRRLRVVDAVDAAVVGELTKKRLQVRPNLYKALQNLRRSDHDIIMWVDAICINQENGEEKKIQVARMAEIYSSAKRVCIWLGPGNERSNSAMKFVTDILDMKELANRVQDEKCTEKWSDLIYLMGKDWFSRRWVIQELALARDATVHCGQEETHWDDFKDAISLFVLHFGTIRELFKRSKRFEDDQYAIGELDPLGAKVLVDVTSNIFRREADGTIFEPILSLETLVSTLSRFETSDPRDTINAFRNISREVHRRSPSRRAQAQTSTETQIPSSEEVQAFNKEPPEPDYSTDLLQVYTDFVRWVIETTGSIDIICRHWAIPEKRTRMPYHYPVLSTLPSWIQEISELPYGRENEGNRRKNGDSFVGLPDRKCYNASYGRRADGPDGAWFGTCRQQAVSPPPSHPNGVSNGTRSPNVQKIRDPSLYVKGLLIDTVTWKSDAIPDGVIPKVCLEKGDWSTDKETEVFDLRAPDKLWRTLVADRGPDGRNPPSLYHRACLECLMNDTPNGHINTNELLRGQPDIIVKEYLKRVQAVTWNRKFLETSSEKEGVEKLFGLGPPNTQLHDIVCVLFGCSVPCILRERKLEDGQIYFQFIGEAYIYGKMDGEAVSVLSAEALASQTKTFRLM